MDPAYELVEGPPDAQAYLALRERSGLSTKTVEQAELAIRGSWYSAHVVHVASGRIVAMGRVVGDGGWYFHIADMATLPEHQRRGIGDAVLNRLVDTIRDRAPANAYITLLADKPGRPLYRRHGFTETAPSSIGMVLPFDRVAR